MRVKSKQEIRNKARLTYCLVDILEYDIENLKNDTNECNPDDLIITLQEAKETLQNITDLITEIEYVLYLEKHEES